MHILRAISWTLSRCVAALALSACLVPLARAADPPRTGFPEKSVTIVVPFSPGGSPDLLARTIGQKLSERWGKPVVIENRAGAGGNIASAYVAKAAPDGYTLLMGTDGPLAINTLLYEKLQFDPVKDFTPVALLASVDFLLVTDPQLPVRNAGELVAYAGKQQVPLSYGSAGKGSQHHLGMELFKRAAKVDFLHVPYKGVMPAATDVMAGHLSLMFMSISSGASAVQAGKLKALATTGKHRHALFPKLPTLAESGVPGFDLRAWFGLVGPAGMPRGLTRSLNADLNRVLDMGDVKARLVADGFEIRGGSPEEFSALIRDEADRWKRLASSISVRAD